MNLSRIRLHMGKGRVRLDLSAKEAGQIIVIFALMLTSLIGLVGIAIDVTYAWRNGLQVQRAADAAAMAGVVYLPGNLTEANNRADAIALANGYPGTGGQTVAVAPNPSNDHQLDVTITAPVQTFFVRLFGINTWTVSRSARAAYVMPVPMGSPLPYYGVGCYVLQSPATNPPCSIASNNGVGSSGVPGGYGNLGGWGAIITKGGNANNGDAYAPFYNAGYSPATNASYDADGYMYTVELPVGGSISLFDPGFCAMGANGAAGNYGAGDHWIDHDNNNNNAHSPVSTYYTLWNTNGQPINPSGWTKQPLNNTTGGLFENQKGSDTANGGPANGGGYSTSTCDAYHNAWYAWPIAQGLGAGTYEVQVYTTNPGDASINQYTNAENMFSIAATGANSKVYGQSRMAVYNNMAGSSAGQQFFMARIDQPSGVGKSLAIDLFDPGDVGGDAFLQIWSPSGAGATTMQVTDFSYTTEGPCIAGNSDACSGSNRSQIQTAKGGSKSFNSTWIHILVRMHGPGNTDYGSSGLWSPAGLTPPQPGWWQVKYITGAANDTTTWSVNVVGNPVHLVPVG